MKLQTQIRLKKQQHDQIDYDSNILLLGSCFSENIGAKFNFNKIQSKSNPFGILFHPLAIENLIVRSLNKDYYCKEDFYSSNEQWCCLDAHSKLNQVSKEKLVKELNTQIDQTHNQLKKSTHIIITLGTSYVYRHITSDLIVANCHKLPQKQFLKELLSVKEITESLEAVISLIRAVNPDFNLIFTVSPVRHLKDGFTENTRSKSHLLTAIHDVVEQERRAHYFPSYEIMMDELRDYRFYTSDMLHPNDLAVDYIWEKFKLVWFTKEAIRISEKVISIQAKKAHRPFNKFSVAHQSFLANLQLEIDELCANYPHISFL